MKQPALFITLIRALRVYQWTKNLLVFAPLLFAQQFLDTTQLFRSILAFAAFCMAASATYLFNDLLDIEKDRAHPIKRHRPLASGALRIPVAIALIVLLTLVALILAYGIRPQFLLILIFYQGLTLSYSLWLKHWIIIDVLAVSMGFVIRATAGAIALDVVFSNWLVVCTLFLAMFLSLNKRRSELVLLEEGAQNHRRVHDHYTIHYLDQLILIMAGGALITYTIYTCSPEVVERLHTDKLYLTLPFVVYGLFRYLFLVHHHAGGGDPSKTLISDWPLGLNVFLWALSCAAIIYIT